MNVLLPLGEPNGVEKNNTDDITHIEGKQMEIYPLATLDAFEQLSDDFCNIL